jgi:hypothetical protein
MAMSKLRFSAVTTFGVIALGGGCLGVAREASDHTTESTIVLPKHPDAGSDLCP